MSFDISEARARYGAILRITSGPGFFYFRLPSKTEFDTYNELINKAKIPLLASDYLIDRCLLYPLDSDMLVGEIIPLANILVERSGFHDIKHFENLVNTYRDKSGELGEKVIGLILKAFPVYTLKQVEDMNAREIARHLVLSEIILEQPTGMAQTNPLAGRTQQLSKELSDKDKAQVEKLRTISQEALNQVKGK